MGWSFRKSIKIAPGIRINLSKSGVSASIGGKGASYNTRGRFTASIPGTGISYSQQFATRRTTKPIGSAVAASERIDSESTARLSKREQATRDFVVQLQDRTTAALQQYFLSHGVYVRASDLSDAVTLEDHQEFLGTLIREFEITTKAIKLAVDIGTISLAEKEKAMLALYEIEATCESHRGARGALEAVAAALNNKILSWPSTPSFFWPFAWCVVGFLCFLGGNFDAGMVLIAIPFLYGLYKLKSFEKKKTSVLQEIAEADVQFDALLTSEISPRPALVVRKDKTLVKASVLAVVILVLILVGVGSGSKDSQLAVSAPETSKPSNGNAPNEKPSKVKIAASNSPSPAPVPVPSSNPISASTFETSFDCAKAHSYVENLVCSDQELAAADIQLASLFADAKAASRDQAEFKQRARRAWNYREKNCHDHECVARWYVDQKMALTEMIASSE